MNERLRGYFACVYLFACIVLGGASAAGAIANAVLQLLGLLLILYVLWSAERPIVRDGANGLKWIVALSALLVLITLVPLPSGLWQALPGRAAVSRGFDLLGISDAAIPVSLTPERSLWSLASLLPPTAMFLMTLHLSSRWRRRLAWVLLAGAVLAISLGGFQLVGGPDSPLRFYQQTNPNRAVGVFSNANHLPTLILMAMPLVGMLASKAVLSRDPQKKGGGLTTSVSVGIFLVVGIVLSGSLAGYAMLLPVALGTFLLFRRRVVGKLSPAWGAALLILVAGFLAVAWTGPLNQQAFESKFTQHSTSRATIWSNTLEAIQDFAPVGSGLGSFSAVYRTYDDPSRATREFVNHAHNDYLELALELGLPAVLLMAAFFLWWLRRSVRAWRDEFSGAPLARVGSIIVAIALVHSLVEYPLRTAALAAVFAMACAFLVPPPSRRRSQSSQSAETGAGLRHLEVD